MGLANWLTVLRILLIPVFITLLVYKQRGPALAVFLAAALTDLLDGYVARHRGSQSRLGAFLDPMADKLLLMSSFVTLTWLKVLPFWIAAVVISRDLILVIGALAIHMGRARRAGGGRSDPHDQRPRPARRHRLPVLRCGRAPRPDARAAGAPARARAHAAAGRRPGPRAGGAEAGRDRHLRQQVRVLLHPPAPARDAPPPLRQGRRLPPVVPA